VKYELPSFTVPASSSTRNPDCTHGWIDPRGACVLCGLQASATYPGWEGEYVPLTPEQRRDLMAAAHQHMDRAHNARAAEAAFNTYCGNVDPEIEFYDLVPPPSETHVTGVFTMNRKDVGIVPTPPMSVQTIDPQNGSQEPG
jgi:hypothetical protein